MTSSVTLDGATVNQPIVPAWKLNQRESLPSTRLMPFSELITNVSAMPRSQAPQPTDRTITDARRREYRYYTDGSLRRTRG